MKVKFVKFDENARIPEKVRPSDMGFDVYAVSEKEIAPNVWQYGLGFGLQIDRDCYMPMIGVNNDFDRSQSFFNNSSFNLSIDIRPRSSIYKTGLVLCNATGTIDESYNGEIKLNFYHVLRSMERYHVGDKIAQMKLGMAFPMKFVEVDKLDDTDRGDGGFGSTGK